MNDLPIIHVYPGGTPSDSELEAQRDAVHALEVARWEVQQRCECVPWLCACEWPIGQVQG